MKNLLSIGLLLVFLLPTLAKVDIFIRYRMNQDFIASKLCKSRNEPINMCYGQCYLNDQLQKVDGTQDEELPNDIRHQQEIQLFSPPLVSNNLLTPNFNRKAPLTMGTDLPHTSPHLRGIFRPPKAHFS